MVATAARTIKQKLIDTINEQNNLSLEFEQVTFDLPVTLDPTVVDLIDPAKRNTSVRFTAGSTGGSRVEAVVKYNRLSLPKMFALYSKTIPDDPSAVTLHDILPAIGERLGINLDAEDFYPVPITPAADGMRAVGLVPKTESYVYFGVVGLLLSNEAEAGLEHDVDIVSPFMLDGDGFPWMGTQSHYLRLALPDGPEIVMKGAQYHGLSGIDRTPTPVVGVTRDTYSVPLLGEYHEHGFDSEFQPICFGIGQASGSIFDDYEFALEHTLNYLGGGQHTQTFTLEYVEAPNAVLQFERFRDVTNVGPGVSPPTAWDADTQSYRIVVTDPATTMQGIQSSAEDGYGLPVGEFAAVSITINALPASGSVDVTVNLGESQGTYTFNAIGTYTYEIQALEGASNEDSWATVMVGFANDVSLQGLDVVIEPLPEYTQYVGLRDTATGQVVNNVRGVLINVPNGDPSLVTGTLEARIGDLDPRVYPMAGSGLMYGAQDLTITVRKVSTSTEHAVSVRLVNTDSREAPAAELLNQQIWFDNDCPAEFRGDDGEWPELSDLGDPAPLMDFVVARSQDFATTAVLRFALERDSISDYSGGRTFDNREMINGPNFHEYLVNSQAWVIDFGFHSTDGTPILNAQNTIELTLWAHHFMFEEETNNGVLSSITPFTFTVVSDGAGGHNIVCPELSYSHPLALWKSGTNAASGRIHSKDFGALIDTAIGMGVNGEGSPYGYYRAVLKRKQGEQIVSKTSCSAMLDVGQDA